MIDTSPIPEKANSAVGSLGTDAAAFVPTLACHLGWLGLVSDDYTHAVVRLATVTHACVNHLLWAAVELLPNEIRSPPDDGVKIPCGEHRVLVSRKAMRLADAIAWYDNAWNGCATVPGQSFPIQTGRLGPEPHGRRFVLRDDLPFSAAWHSTPRAHRLVALEELPTPVEEMVRGMAKVPRFMRAREWLEEQLHFDVLAYDDWLGSVALIAPNPIQRGAGVRISARSPGSETITLRGGPRVGAKIQGVEVVFQERRAGGAGWRASVSLNRLGVASATMPGPIDALGHQIVCERRGLLYEDLPSQFLRAINLHVSTDTTERVSQPVRRRRTDPAPPVVRTPLREKPPEVARTVDPLGRLRLLQARRDDRFGQFRPLRVATAVEDVVVFENDRAEAVRFIRSQIARARHQVLFVDPYFEPADLLEFADAAEQRGVGIRALFAPRQAHFRERSEVAPEYVSSNGDWLIAELKRMAMPDLGYGPVDLRVTRHRRFHDRFLQVDDTLWHCGHSFNSVGTGEISAMSRIARPQELANIIDDTFLEAETFEHFWERESQPTATVKASPWIPRMLLRAAGWLENLSRKWAIDDDGA